MTSRLSAALALALLALGCEQRPAAALPRHQRLGILHDLVLYDRPRAAGGPFFLDRFESTCADWRTFLVATGTEPTKQVQELWGGSEPKLGRRQHPITRISWHEADAFARWRLCRLPRADEFRHAASAGGTSEFPWGDEAEPVRGNTGDLGLCEAQPVGTFESGRDRVGTYDLLGNVAEWSLGVPDSVWWDLVVTSDEPLLARGWLGYPQAGALAPWCRTGLQPGFALLARERSSPRLVLGGHFASPGVIVGKARDAALWPRAPGEWGDTTGVRVATTPAELLRALAALPDAPTPEEAEAVRAFLVDRAHRSQLVTAWRELAGGRASGPVAALLRAELER